MARNSRAAADAADRSGPTGCSEHTYVRSGSAGDSPEGEQCSERINVLQCQRLSAGSE